MIPHARPVMSDKESLYLQECVTTNFVSSVGPFVDRFERQVAEATGCAGAVATSSGTTALHASLLTVGVGRDDLVVLPSFTFIASANAIAHCGAMPWLMDVDAESWTLDAGLVRRAFDRETHRDGDQLIHAPTGRRVAAIMPVHTLGVAADMEALSRIAAEHRLPIVADAAAAIGATFRGRPIGAMGADLSVISFNGNKTITAGGGGAIVGNDAPLLRLARHLTTTARAGEEYAHDRVGYNYRMTNLQAAVGCAQMDRWQEMVEAKKRIRRRYDEAFGNHPSLSAFPDPPDRESACWLSGIRIRLTSPSIESLRERLRAEGIETRAFWQPVHRQLPYREAPASEMPVTELLWRTILTLPCSTDLSEADQTRVIDAVRSAVQG
ncbi:MAG: pyridoxal-5'-phosphate-dependent protein [Alphaproteobacteria bacterium]|nr:pyridoxal-5'-phosphate-dependent protein [Alphaproteobacteria bacterium]